MLPCAVGTRMERVGAPSLKGGSFSTVQCVAMRSRSAPARPDVDALPLGVPTRVAKGGCRQRALSCGMGVSVLQFRMRILVGQGRCG